MDMQHGKEAHKEGKELSELYLSLELPKIYHYNKECE